jgi:hypothetical protein
METNTRRALLGGLPLLAIAAACGKKQPVSTAEVLAVSNGKAPMSDPLDPAWDERPVHRAALVHREMVEPRLMSPTTPELRIRAMSDGADARPASNGMLNRG